MKNSLKHFYAKYFIALLLVFSFSIVYSQDTDGDGISNATDLDSDNDGILNIAEGLTSRTPDFSLLSAASTIFVTSQNFDSSASCANEYSSTMSAIYSSSNNSGNRPPNSPIGDANGNIGFAIQGNQATGYEQATLTFDNPVYLRIYNSDKVGPPNGTTYGAFDDQDEWTLNTDRGGFKIVNDDAFQQSLTVNSGTQIKFQNGNAPNSTTFDVRTTTAVTSLVLTFRSTNNNTSDNYSPIRVEILVPNDTDCDSTPNYLDLDSDNDGCFDAIEGDENVLAAQLNANGSINITTNGGVGVTPDVDQGVPNLVNSGGAADSGNDVGQGVGESQNATVNLCHCYKKPVLNSGINVPTKYGITALSRAGSEAAEWPGIRQSGWMVLESKSKGFVANKMAFDASRNPVNIPAANFVEGMMVYDTTNNCLEIYDGTKWSCYTEQTCPE